MISAECSRHPRVLSILGFARSVWYAKPVAERKKPGRKPKGVPEEFVTYRHLPGHGFWYAVTVIDYCARYLLACHFTASYGRRCGRGA